MGQNLGNMQSPDLDQLAIARGMSPGQAGNASGGPQNGKNQAAPMQPMVNSAPPQAPGASPEEQFGPGGSMGQQSPPPGMVGGNSPMGGNPLSGMMGGFDKAKLAAMLTRFGNTLGKQRIR
jgi:hypothetical protein